MTKARQKLAVVIPCYKVTAQISTVIRQIPADVWRIYCIDDCCPDQSGSTVLDEFQNNPRVVVYRRESNGGVGAATKTGYMMALADGADIIVKIDGDGQMNPRLIPLFTAPIENGDCDYTKGNRFYKISSLQNMPYLRKIGNAGLSFLAKFSTGYWKVFDPSNGYTAIDSSVLAELPLDKISDRFFFEPDMLFRLNLLGACIEEIPMEAVYGDEVSNLNEWDALAIFPILHFRNLVKRLLYSYFLRNFSIASVHLVFGLLLVLFGLIVGINAWMDSVMTGIVASSGTVMLASFPLLIGNHLLLNFIGFDMIVSISKPIHPKLKHKAQLINQNSSINDVSNLSERPPAP